MDLSKLNNMTDFELNTSMVENSKEILPNLVANANSFSDGYFGLLVMTIMYFFLVYTLFRDDGDIKLDILRSSLKASGFSSILGIIMLVTGLISSYQHVVWFLMLFLIQIIAVYMLKRKNN